MILMKTNGFRLLWGQLFLSVAVEAHNENKEIHFCEHTHGWKGEISRDLWRMIFFLPLLTLFRSWNQFCLETFPSRSPHVVKHKSLVQMASFGNCNSSVQKPQSFIYVFDCCATFSSVIRLERKGDWGKTTHIAIINPSADPKRHLPNLMSLPRKLISEMFQDRIVSSYQNFGT